MIALQPGLVLHRDYFSRAAQESLLADVRAILAQAPLFAPTMPQTGKPFSVRMSNCGALGWVSDKERGYRYQSVHPVTGAAWPKMPARLLQAWAALSGCPRAPQACLINFYGPEARMGLHQDRDEQDFDAPVMSVSLGDSCLFRYGGVLRAAPTRSIKLHSGDVLMIGGASRLCFHGVDRLYRGSSTLLGFAGRYNLTLRRVGD